MTHDASPPALDSSEGRRTVVGLALLQALLLLIFHEGLESDWTLFADITVRTVYLTLALALPTTLYLLVDDPRERFPWIAAGAVGLLFLPLAWYAGSLCAPDAGVRSEAVLAPFGLSLFGAWFFGAALLQTRQRARSISYEALYEALWHNALSLVLAGLFIGAFWIMLFLMAALFEVLGIDFFEELFTDRRFAYAATGLVGGVGLALVRSRGGAITSTREVLLTLVNALLPLGALIALPFLVTLPFTGLEPLWETGRAALLLMLLQVVIMLLLNGVFEDGRVAPPYARPLRLLVEATVATLPLFGILTGIAFHLRIDQYGWTAERFWGVLFAAFLTAYALACATAVVRRGEYWMGLLRPANRVFALALILILLLANTPLLHPLRITASSQSARIANSERPVSELQDAVRHLRFQSGEPGYRALQKLQTDQRLAERPELVALIDTALASDTWFYFESDAPADDLASRLTLAPDTLTLPDSLLQVLAAAPSGRSCTIGDVDCTLAAADLLQGGEREYILGIHRTDLLQVHVFARIDGQWQMARHADVRHGERADSLLAAFRRGEITTAPSPWRDLVVGGERLELR